MYDYILPKLADELQVEVAALKAVIEVESMGSGMLSDGRPKILFEPHVFWRELKKQGLDPYEYVQGNDDILRPEWIRQYGSQSSQWPKMERAKKINLEAALRSASYGMFQVMGFNAEMCGFKSVFEFVEAMYSTEGQILAFVGFVKKRGLVDELQRHNWDGFAYVYNGRGYAKHGYHIKLEEAYERFSG